MEGTGTLRILVTHLPITIFDADKYIKCVYTHTETYTNVKKSHDYLFYRDLLEYTESKDMYYTPFIF